MMEKGRGLAVIPVVAMIGLAVAPGQVGFPGEAPWRMADRRRPSGGRSPAL